MTGKCGDPATRTNPLPDEAVIVADLQDYYVKLSGEELLNELVKPGCLQLWVEIYDPMTLDIFRQKMSMAQQEAL